jgi:hypothetical protein
MAYGALVSDNFNLISKSDLIDAGYIPPAPVMACFWCGVFQVAALRAKPRP